MPTITIDRRWVGENGIGRFSTEVLSRLTGSFASLGSEMSPTSPLDVINPSRLRLSASDTIFSPGFNAGITRARQLLVVHDLIHLQNGPDKSLLKSIFYNTVVKRAVHRAGIVMTVSETSARAIRQWLGRSEVEIVVVGNGRSAAFQSSGAKAKFDRPTFLYVGNLKSHKNVDVLFRALQLRHDYDLLLVTGDSEDAQARVHTHGLSRQVTVLSGLSDDELACLYRGSSGVLLPSLLEGFGLPALEAMSCGTRVAFWAGCESIAEICAEAGVSVQSSTEATEWASAMDVLAAAAMRGSVMMPSEWWAKYDWDRVEERVSLILDAEAFRAS